MGSEEQKGKAQEMFDNVVSGALILLAEFKLAALRGEVTVEEDFFMGSLTESVIFRGHKVFIGRNYFGWRTVEELRKLPINSVTLLAESTADEDQYTTEYKFQYTMYTYDGSVFCEPIQAELRALEIKASEWASAR